MRLRGHPIHVMLVHFPVALWPAHACLHLFAAQFPAAAAATIGFWLIAMGTALGWLAALFGIPDLVALAEENGARLSNGLTHAIVNGTVLIGFSVIVGVEYRAFPVISHGVGFLSTEWALVVIMFAGNYFGGAVIWQKSG